MLYFIMVLLSMIFHRIFTEVFIGKEAADMIWDVLRQELENLPRAQRSVAEFVLKNPSEALFMNSQQLAASSRTSEATVVRLAVALGYDGFPEFKEALQIEAKDQLSTFGRLREHRLHSDSEHLLSDVISREMEMASSCLDQADGKDIRDLAKAICIADSIYLIGLRSAKSLAIYMQFYLSWFLPNVYVPDTDSLESRLVSASSRSLIIGISFPRYTRLTLECIRMGNRMGLDTAAITDSDASPLAREAQIAVKAPCNHVAHIDSLMIPLGMINAILIEVTNRLGPQALSRLEKLENIWSDSGVYC